MSNLATSCVDWADIDNVGAASVLRILADHAGDHSGENWTCYPSVLRIARFTKMGERTVERHLAWLVEERWIKRRRLRRKDGSLAGYRYWLNRPRLLAELAAAQAREAAAEDDPGEWTEEVIEGEEPPANLAGGPPAKNDETTRQIVLSPPANLAGHEPPIEPSDRTSQSVRVREALDRLRAVYPELGAKNTNWPQAEAALAGPLERYGLDRLVAAAAAFAADPDMAGRKHLPGLQTWLSADGFLPWLPRAKAPSFAAADGAKGPAGERRVFGGPAEIRAALVAATDEGFARSYLDPARCEDGCIVARFTDAAAKLRQAFKRTAFTDLRVLGPGDPPPPAAAPTVPTQPSLLLEETD